MERINAFSVEMIENDGKRELSYGGTYYGPIGKFIGSVEDDEKNYYLLFKTSKDELFMKQAVIDTEVVMTSNGPMVYETILVGETSKEISNKVLLNLLEKGKADVSLGLIQHNNTVFITKDELLEELNALKKANPKKPLKACLEIESLEKKLVKKEKAK